VRKYLYPLLLLGFGAALAAIFVFKKPVARIPELKDRKGGLALGGEWINAKNAMQTLQAKLRQDPNDHKAQLMLAQGYMQEARVTGDHTYYDSAAMQLLEKVLADQPQNFEALCSKASLCLTQHHFAQGLTVAEEAVKVNPYSAFVYGLLCDAHVELGHYDEAVKMADKMNKVRPDLRAYARVSYLREIYGDIPGAIEAMGMATQAGYVGLEQTEWTRVQLGHLYENSGNLPEAESQYQQALAVRPYYAYALAGLGRVAAARKDYPTAIKHLEQARATVKDYAFADELADLYRLNKQPEQARKMADEAIKQLSDAAAEADENEQLGHYADRELAYAYLKTGDNDKALQHAKIEYERRPDNIDVNETLAWVHYKRGEYADAQKYMQVALRTHSQNPVLLCRAGLIATKAGQPAEGQAMITKALAINPYLSPDLAAEGKNLLAVR
jgi:tetratricopeptide (TPR) repeat protein